MADLGPDPNPLPPIKNPDGSPVTVDQLSAQKSAAAMAGNANAAAAAQQAAQQAQYEGRFQYGGHAGGAFEAANRYNQAGIWGQSRPGERIDYSGANYDRQQAGNSRAEQGNAMGLMRARAYGQVPSIAGMQAQRDIGRATADQTSIAAGARGPAGLALAQQGAANNSANAISSISNQAQINGAMERERAEGAYFNAASGMRGGDFQAGGMAAQQAQAQAQMNQAARDANDRYQLGMTGFETGVQNAQLGAQGNKVAIETGQAVAAANRASAQSMHNDDRLDKYIGLGLGGVGTAASIYALNAFGGSSGPAINGTAGVAGGQAPDNSYGVPDYQGEGSYVDPNDPNDPRNWTGDSDISAKQNIRPAFAMGEQAGLGMRSGDPRAEAWDEGHKAALADVQRLGLMAPDKLKAYGEHPAAKAVRELKASAWDEGHRGADPGTQQLAQGLAPSFYDYKQGLGTPGRKFGPMANTMLENPATATAVRQNPQTGMLSIDGSDGLKVALGGVGHLAQRQQQTEEELAALRAERSTPGLMAGPSIGDQYLNTVRGYR